MKVKELIEKLKGFDKNQEVILGYYNAEYNEWQNVWPFVIDTVEEFKKKQTFQELNYINKDSDLDAKSIILWGY